MISVYLVVGIIILRPPYIHHRHIRKTRIAAVKRIKSIQPAGVYWLSFAKRRVSIIHIAAKAVVPGYQYAWIFAAGTYLNSGVEPPEVLVQITDWVVSFVVLTVLFAFIFKVLPSVPLHWGDVTIGAVATSLLFAAGKFLLGVYLGKAGFTDTYGAAGSLVIVLVWVYYSAQVLFLGAEFTRAYACRFGSMCVPNNDQPGS